MAEINNAQSPQLIAPQGRSDFVQSLFQPVSNEKPTPEAPDQVVKKGSLISFNYMFMKHDPYPMVIVTDIIYGQRIRGVNLNYLTFHDIKQLLNQYGENVAFSYGSIKNDRSVIAALNAFREYKWMGVRQMKKLNSDFLLQTIGVARSYDPSQMQSMRQAVQNQIKQQVNQKAAEMTKSFFPQKSTGTIGTIGTIPTIPTSK